MKEKNAQFCENFQQMSFADIVDLYQSVGWYKYSDHPDDLKSAFLHSSYCCFCSIQGKLVGLIRTLTDEVAIHYIQDLLVDPAYQGQGIGKKLVEHAMNKFPKVRVTALITDDEQKQKLFYQSLNFVNLSDLKKRPMNCYISREDLELFLGN